jgi:hypothetical protein
MGLGNSLFVLCAAIYYCESYGYTLELVKTDALLFGTSNMFNKSKCYKIGDTLVPYNKTIFGKLTFIDKLTDECIEIHNDYTNNKRDPQNKNILIAGYNQNVELFRSIMSKIPKYINIDDAIIKTYIFEKYGDIQKATMLGVRIGNDFKHMKKITPHSYLKALKYLENNGNHTDQIYVIGDMPTSEYFKETNKFKEVVECDIIQFYFGTMCKNFVLSESTFHLWMAYLGTDFGEKADKTVICFNDTDITNRHFDLDNWVKLDYSGDELPKTLTTIHHVCSLGTLCLSAQLCKDIQLKLESYPFDWIFSSFETITHCINDDFKTFLDKSYYTDVKDKLLGHRQCGHTLYHPNMFNHHDLRTDADYNYYKRCIERFKQLLRVNTNKLFVVAFDNQSKNNCDAIKDQVFKLNKFLKTLTHNYYILAVIHILEQDNTYHTITNNENIKFLELYAKSASYGTGFDDRNEYDYLQKTILDNYSFQVKKLVMSPKNLVYVGIFFNETYLEFLKLLLISIKLFSRTDTFDLLILTTKAFETHIQQLSNSINIPIKMKFFDYTTKNQASNAHLHIFEYKDIGLYKKVLYLDADILVQRDLTEFFTFEMEDKLYACEEMYTLRFASHGAPFFDFSKIDINTKGFNSSVLLFQNTSTMRQMFANMIEHISTMENNSQIMPYWGSNPFLNYHAIKDNLFCSTYMNDTVFLTVQSSSDNLLQEIRKPISPYENKPTILHHFLDPDKMVAMKQHMNHLLNYYASKSVSNNNTLNGPINKRYSWGKGFIAFETNNVLETWWGRGIYKLIDTCAVKASWNGYHHIVIFDPTFTQYTSVCINNYDIVCGVRIES